MVLTFDSRGGRNESSWSVIGILYYENMSWFLKSKGVLWWYFTYRQKKITKMLFLSSKYLNHIVMLKLSLKLKIRKKSYFVLLTSMMTFWSRILTVNLFFLNATSSRKFTQVSIVILKLECWVVSIQRNTKSLKVVLHQKTRNETFLVKAPNQTIRMKVQNLVFSHFVRMFILYSLFSHIYLFYTFHSDEDFRPKRYFFVLYISPVNPVLTISERQVYQLRLK